MSFGLSGLNESQCSTIENHMDNEMESDMIILITWGLIIKPENQPTCDEVYLMYLLLTIVAKGIWEHKFGNFLGPFCSTMLPMNSLSLCSAP